MANDLPVPRAAAMNAIPIIKGEIHNILAHMRADARYASPMRFVQELAFDEHPLLQSLRELHEQLSIFEFKSDQRPDLVWYITPFCSAISGRDISASITGAALSALHKFLLYNFLVPEVLGAKDGMTLVAKSVLHCTFEESDHPTSNAKITGNSRSSRALQKSTTASGGGISSSSQQHTTSPQVEDEQVVLKLLSLSALIVRCSLSFTTKEQPPLLDATLIMGLLDTCLHVSHRAKNASPLLKGAAGDALGQIVLVVFGMRHDDNSNNKRNTGAPGDANSIVVQARAAILAKLTSLVNASDHAGDTCVVSLTLINIALETMMRNTPSNAEIAILQNDLCKHLLQRSITRDLTILSLTLRVIFNLFQTIRNHLKVPLEVFLTSVHLRILDCNSNEQKEVALESLLEFCQEPALMQDLYLNYDCDVHCTNLFEAICTALAQASELVIEEGSGIASPTAASQSQSSHSVDQHHHHHTTQPPLNALNRLAIDGILAVIDSIARRCQDTTAQNRRRSTPPPLSGNSSIFSSEASDTESESTSGCQADISSALRYARAIPVGATVSTANENKTAWESASSVEAQMLLLKRKRKKLWMATVALEFNRKPMGKEWVQVAQQSNLLPNPATAHAVADFLYSTPHLDKTQMGEYISKGPCSKYPFHEQVRTAYCSLFDFHGMTFANALRAFLLKFRLPGEAQCIDRLMEAFAVRLYQQQQEKSQDCNVQTPPETSQSPPSLLPFRSSDAVFVLAFSTIMLNTDLHNPTIKEERRMTLQQFLRNNRGINNGDDLPDAFLTDLYTQIKESEIQVKKELSDVVQRHAMDYSHWDGLLSSKSNQVSKPFFTPADAARQNVFQAGVHERDMFLAISKSAIKCISSVFVRSMDDARVVKALKGFRQMAKICVYFDMDETLNEIFKVLLDHGRNYIMHCIALDYAEYDGNAQKGEEDDVAESFDEPPTDTAAPLPKHLLSLNQPEVDDSVEHPTHHELLGSASHRGLLALEFVLSLIRAEKSRLREAWPTLIECLCALRDAKALPLGLADLDDFADSHGKVLPPSSCAIQSQQRLDEYYSALSSPDDMKQQGWLNLPSFFKREPALLEGGHEARGPLTNREISVHSNALLSVTQSAELEHIVLMRPDHLPLAKQTIRALLDAIDAKSYQDDPLFEQHAVFSLELAARAFFANRDRAIEILPMFLAKFETVLGASQNSPDESDTNLHLPSPFLTERIVVTILRACIHLYDIPDVRPSLRSSLQLFMGLPSNLTRRIADRFACGMAIILRGSFYSFESVEEWNFFGDILDMLAHFGAGRGFIFDGIASTVEYALPSEASPELNSSIEGCKLIPTEGCVIFCRLLTRYVLGSYEKDISLNVPAMLCLEKVYAYLPHSIQLNTGPASCTAHTAIADMELWENVVVSFFSVCQSSDPDASQQASRCFQSFLQNVTTAAVPNTKWIAILDMMVTSKQPPVDSEAARINTMDVVVNTLLKTLPHLSSQKENWEDLSAIICLTATLIGENLREGRRGAVQRLFECTVDIVTKMCNNLVAKDFGGDDGYCKWASETLVLELENVGAGGGTFINMAAITKNP